jgi:hypothetical protein
VFKLPRVFFFTTATTFFEFVGVTGGSGEDDPHKRKAKKKLPTMERKKQKFATCFDRKKGLRGSGVG